MLENINKKISLGVFLIRHKIDGINTIEIVLDALFDVYCEILLIKLNDDSNIDLTKYENQVKIQIAIKSNEEKYAKLRQSTWTVVNRMQLMKDVKFIP